MSVATTEPVGPTRRAAARVWPPAPAATSSTAAAGGDAGRVEHALGRRAEPVLQRRPPAVPGLGGVLPLPAGGGLVLDRIEAHRVPPRLGTSSNRWAPDRPADRGRFRPGSSPDDSVRRAATMGRGARIPGRWIWLAGTSCSAGSASWSGRALGGQRVTVMVTGEAGVGKTSLVRAVAAAAAGRAPGSGGAPASTWTALRATGPGPRRSTAWCGRSGPTGRAAGRRRRALLATIVPSLGDAVARRADRPGPAPAPRCRQPVARHAGLGTGRWSSCSTTSSGPTSRRWRCFDFVARAAGRSGVCLIGAYRHNELGRLGPGRLASARQPRRARPRRGHRRRCHPRARRAT